MAVVLMCGPSGAGKSVLATHLEGQGWLRLSIDVEAWGRGVTSLPMPVDLVAEIEDELVGRLVDAVGRDEDVVVDFPFATRALRDEYRRIVADLGEVAETVFIPVDRQAALDRVRARQGSGPDDHRLTDEALLAQHDAFEPPTFAEYPLRVLDDDLTIRHVRGDEADVLLRFWAGAAENASRPTDSGAAVRQLLRRDPASVVVAESGGRIVGTVIAGWDGWRAHLYRLAVHPDARGRGIGRRLLHHGEQRLISLGATRLDAMVLDANDAGAGLWRAAGYRPQGEWTRWVKPVGDR